MEPYIALQIEIIWSQEWKAMFQDADAKIQSDKTNTEFYLQHKNNQIKWLILFMEYTNCMEKQAFQYCGILNESNDAYWGQKHLLMCHAIFLPEQSESTLQLWQNWLISGLTASYQ